MKKNEYIFKILGISAILFLVTSTLAEADYLKKTTDLSVTDAAGNIFYVSPTGSGTTCSTANPCSLTTGKDKLNAGDVLYLKSGTYLSSSKISFSKSGTASARITIEKDPSSSGTAVISGDVNGNGLVDETDGPRTADPVTLHEFTPLVQISGSYVTIKDIEIKFSGGRGIQSGGTDNILSNLNVHHSWGNAIYVYAPYNIVENSRVWRGDENNYCGGVGGKRRCTGNWGGGLGWGAAGANTSPGPAHHIIVRGNIVYNNSGEGIICVHSDYSTVENNISYDNWGLGIDLDKCAYATVQNNLIYYTSDKSWWRTTDSSGNPIRPGSGILISNEDVGTNSRDYPLGHDRKIINNIIVGAGSQITFWPGEGGTPLLDSSRLINDVIANNTLVEAQNNGTGINLDKPIQLGLGHTNTRIANNLVLQTNGSLASVDTSAGLTFDHNLWSRTPPSNVSSSTDIVGNPKLVDPNRTRTVGQVVADWYKLTSSSPAINKGISLPQVLNDFFGNPRSNPPDTGAHEYAYSNNTPTPTNNITPTPGGKPGDCGGPNGTPDGFVDLFDYGSLSRSFGLTQGQPGFNTKCDFYHDANNIIDLFDYQILANNFGK